VPSGTLDAYFRPRGILVVGASRDPRKWGRQILDFTVRQGFKGALYAVNPAAVGFDGIPGVTFVGQPQDISEPVDLAVVVLRAGDTPDAVAACADAGVRAAVLPASGFGERGPAGKLLEEQLLAISARTGIRLLGPNGLGLFVAPAGINLTPNDDIPAGSVALASQSGNVAIALFAEATRAHIGFSACVGVGNQIDVSFGELLTHFAADPSARVVACYIEGLRGRGREFRAGLAACRDAGKPVVILKTGRSSQGAAAVLTHTGSLAADDRVWQAVFDEAEAVRVGSTEEMVDVLAVLLALPPRLGPRVMVLTNGGGDTVMAADTLVESGLEFARLSPSTRAKLEALTPADAPRVESGNPATLDTAGGADEDPQLLAECVRVVAADRAVDVVLLSGVFGGYPDLREAELACVDDLLAARADGMPIVMQSAYGNVGEEPLEKLKAGGIPVYPTVQRLARALASVVRSDDRHATSPADDSDNTSRILGITETADLLGRYGIAVPELHLVTDGAALRCVAARANYPLCIKLADPVVSHKSDVGGVRLDLVDSEAAATAAQELWQRFPDSTLVVMPMLPPGLELIAGTTSDPLFGPTVLVGRGGVWAEFEQDVSVRLAPVTPDEARRMILELRCAPMLVGERGQAQLDLSALAAVVSALSRVAVEHPQLSVEINPLFLYSHGYGVADLRASAVEGVDQAIPAAPNF
jgi:acetyltransferase